MEAEIGSENKYCLSLHGTLVDGKFQSVKRCDIEMKTPIISYTTCSNVRLITLRRSLDSCSLTKLYATPIVNGNKFKHSITKVRGSNIPKNFRRIVWNYPGKINCQPAL